MTKLKELNFHGPMSLCGHQFMMYHGHRILIPSNEQFSAIQFRFLLKEINDIISQDEWDSPV